MLYEFKFTDLSFSEATHFLSENCIQYTADEIWNKVWVYYDPVDFDSHTYPKLKELSVSVKELDENRS